MSTSQCVAFLVRCMLGTEYPECSVA